MKKLKTNELRKLYLDFFVERGHRLVKSDSLVPANDPSVLFTSAGMNQFKDYFLGKCKDFKRATSAQKCFRTGDLEQVGQTPYHHTFFEMLGNFSFGDYFKYEAISWAWEFVTEVLEIDKTDLWVSVYQDDNEAYEIWKHDIGLASDKIKKFGPKDNFWPSNAILDGPNGPCGPCSEIYYQKEGGPSVEVWNLVFTQFNRGDGGLLESLPTKNIDTGMGLERMASVLQGVTSNFKIDIFMPIVLSVKKSVELKQENLIYTLADHVRAVTFCISDGVLPSNDGRGYVVRKLIRRCLYLAQSDRDTKPFLYKIVSSVAETMGDEYPEVRERRDNIAQIINAEEERYIKNILEGGNERLKAEIDDHKKSGKMEFPAEKVVDLYVTYGLPIDDTIEKLHSVNLSTDSTIAIKLIKLEKEKSRASSKMAGSIFSKNSIPLKESQFVGYEIDSCQAKILQIIKDDKEVREAFVGERIGVVLDKTPFYAESGGQVGDKGMIKLFDSDFRLKVTDTKKQDASIIHVAEVLGGVPQQKSIKSGDKVIAEVDKDHREAAKRAHTATHILQAVLRRVLGPHVQQAGSYVEPDRFRFDFTHFKDIAPQELEDIQDLLNEYVIKNDPLNAQVMPKLEAQKTGAIALFGEKYEDEVRIVSIADYSKEFCGGTHLDQTGKIGFILINSESSVGSGLRRIEALTGKLAYEEALNTSRTLNDISLKLKSRREQLLDALEVQAARQKSLEKELSRLQEKELANDIGPMIKAAKKIKKISLIEHKFKNAEVVILRKAVDLLKEKVSSHAVFFLSAVQPENTYFVCGLTADLVTQGLSADEMMKRILPLVGGSGGGRKDFAQGGTKETGKIESAFKEVEKILGEVA